MPSSSLMLLNLLFLLLLHHQVPLLISRNPLPTRLKALLTRIESRERMCFCVQHDLIQGQEVVGAEEEIEVFQCLGLRGRR